MNRHVSDIMTSPAVTIEASRTVADANRLMEELCVRRLPVLAGNELVGIVAAGDMRGSEPYRTVESVMTRDPITVGPDTPVGRVAEVMLTHKIGGIPVISAAGDLLGMVTESDIFELVVEDWRHTQTVGM